MQTEPISVADDVSYGVREPPWPFDDGPEMPSCPIIRALGDQGNLKTI